jgi:hypothetical protein
MMRKPALACLLVALAAPSAAAARAPQTQNLGGLWSGAWGWLLSLVSPVDRGCEIDPDGRCRSSVPQAQLAGDRGCDIDPNGRLSCRASATVPPRRLPPTPSEDRGCSIDPDGRCL